MTTRLLALSLSLCLVGCDNPQAAAPEATRPAPATAAAPAAPSAPAAAADPGPSETVAVLNGQPITLADVDKAGASAVIKARNDLYQARKQALDQLIAERLIDAEAKARGVTPEDLAKAEIQDKVTPVTDAEIEAFYNENKARMRGATLDQVRPQIQGYLEQQRMGERMAAFVDELKAKAQVEVSLDPPRIAVAAGDSPRYGSPDAPVQIIEFSDFQCPYCSRAADTLAQVKEKYGDKVSVVYRHFPLDFHDRANIAAQASQCAADQGKFWEYHDKLFANQRALSDEDLTRYAEEVGLNVGEFNECVKSGKHIETVATDLREGTEAGMSGTPGFFINGRFLGGAQPLEAFSEIIDEELAGDG